MRGEFMGKSQTILTFVRRNLSISWILGLYSYCCLSWSTCNMSPSRTGTHSFASLTVPPFSTSIWLSSHCSCDATVKDCCIFSQYNKLIPIKLLSTEPDHKFAQFNITWSLIMLYDVIAFVMAALSLFSRDFDVIISAKAATANEKKLIGHIAFIFF